MRVTNDGIMRFSVSRLASLFRLFLNIFLFYKSKRYSRDFNVWVFGEWFGKKCGDNSAWLANYVSETFPDIKCVWICEENIDTSVLHESIHTAIMDSSEANSFLRTAGVFVIGQNFYDLSSQGLNYFGGAITLNLWHGVPWKRVGHDAYNRKGLLWCLYNKIYDLANNASYMTSQAKIFDDIWKSSFGVGAEGLIHTGLPRNERLFDASFRRSARSKLVEYLGCENDVNLIAYLPTFRDDPADVFSFSKPVHQTAMDGFLRSTNSVIIEKSHFASLGANFPSGVTDCGRIFFLHHWDVQQLLAATDILISDYSGAVFDFLILDKPVLHFIYDYDQYSVCGRGLYFPKELVLAGEEVDTFESLIDALRRCAEDRRATAHRRRGVRDKFMTFENGRSCETIVEWIFDEISQRRFLP